MTIVNNDFKDVVFGRKSVKEFDPNYKISEEEMLSMLNDAMTAPSSVNFQPWRPVVVVSEEGKNKLRPLVSFNSRQNDTSSAMVVIFADMNPQSHGENIYSNAVEKEYMPKEVKEQILPSIIDMYDSMSKDNMRELVKVDSSLFAMQFMLVARSYGYETNAIGGFDYENIAESLGLDKDRYIPVVIIAVGKPAKESRDTYRLPAEEITKFI
ncbi:nitroreductase family protein [Gemella sp. GH3]|uniref:nitroreductase family protein n=1 Tax=unclassified Gemella TaxID=2624949 RepID=UPI0015D00611|nr:MULTISPECIES: nitroreductase family protein [unclassified Gemella]MBF0713559.1 nitroreductase family protein [Gemella sp. GH3.1]NYS50511.1 nitroreductase family protein [Gemella sp. GH3]